MTRRLLDVDELDGSIEEFEYNEADDTFTVHRTADVGALLDYNKEQANHAEHKGDWWHAAKIPVDVQYIWLQKFGVKAWDRNHWPAVKNLLNSNEWRYLRCQHFQI
jgi:hypothetical protein